MQAQNAFLSKDSDDDDEIDLLGLFGTLLDHKWLIGSVTAAFCAAGIGYATLATPIYRADALVQVEQKAAGIPGLSDIGEMFGAEAKAITEIELIMSRSVIGAAVDNLRLDVVAEPLRLPLAGDWFARRFVPATADETAPALLGLDGYGWGGERIMVFRLEVPPALVARNSSSSPPRTATSACTTTAPRCSKAGSAPRSPATACACSSPSSSPAPAPASR